MGAPAIYISRLTFLDSHPTAGALAIYIPGLKSNSGHTSNIHLQTCILQRAHQRYTSLDSHPTVGTPVIYISGLTVGTLVIYTSGLASYSGRTSDIHLQTRILQQAHQQYTSLDSHSTAGAPIIYIPRLAFFSGGTGNIHSQTHILQWAHQRYTSLDSHSTVGAPAIYIPRLTSHSGCTDDKQPSGSPSLKSFSKIVNLHWVH